MCIWYLIDISSTQSVFDQNFSDLLDLIHLGFASFRLQVDDFINVFSREDMVTSFNPYVKAKSDQ
jgi:hypothetical protein